MKRGTYPGNPKKSLPGRILWLLTHPRVLLEILRYRFVWGNEYFYSGLVDRFPAVGRAGARFLPTRVRIDRPLFVAGLRRTGTTLLYRIMHANPDLFLFHERFPGDRMNWPGYRKSARSWENVWTIKAPDEFRSTVSRYVGPCVRLRYGEWGVKLALEIAYRNSGSPGAEELRHLFRCFPEARVIGIVRDPRDLVLSSLERAGRETRHWIEDYNLMAELFRDLLETHAGRFIVVRYEDLVTSPREIIDLCCAFAGLRCDTKMLEPSSWTVTGRPDYSRDGIVAQAEKWRGAQGAARLVVEQVDRACFPAASAFGYAPAD